MCLSVVCLARSTPHSFLGIRRTDSLLPARLWQRVLQSLGLKSVR